MARVFSASVVYEVCEAEMIDDYGIEVVYEDARGVQRRVSERTLALVREALGEPFSCDYVDTIVTRPGRVVPVSGIAELEQGSEVRIDGRVPSDCPIGYHTLHRHDGGTTRLIVSPGKCHRPSRMWGWLAQLYAARSSSSWGIGDLADLRKLRDWAVATGAGFIMVNPLLASMPIREQDASPYFPVSRRFRNPLWLSVDGLSEAGSSALTPYPKVAAAGRGLNRSELIDRPAAWDAKLRVLRQIFDETERPDAFDQWRRECGDALEDFASWCVLVRELGTRWHDWPYEYRRPDAAGMTQFRALHAREITFWAWLQWLIEQQLDEAPVDVALVQDLPIGVDPDGADAWCWQDYLASGTSVGAPPDRFNLEGQNWGTPPFVPAALRAAGYQPFIDTLRASMARGGGLRIDHIIGMSRLWWVPAGLSPTDGAYVHYPVDDLLDIICLESTRAGAFVVGEDLGTVELPFRDAMRERSILSCKLLWFEEKPPPEWSVEAMASVGSHDLPTIQGMWSGSDTEDQRSFGVTVNDITAETMRDRLVAEGAPWDGDAAEVALAMHRQLAEAPCLLTGIALDDAVGAQRRPNLPGTTNRPNWSYPLPIPIEDLPHHSLTNAIVAVMQHGRSAAAEHS
jgi:4-alpha-glucanotransferase